MDIVSESLTQILNLLSSFILFSILPWDSSRGFRVIAKSISPFELTFELYETAISQGILAIAQIQHYIDG